MIDKNLLLGLGLGYLAAQAARRNPDDPTLDDPSQPRPLSTAPPWSTPEVQENLARLDRMYPEMPDSVKLRMAKQQMMDDYKRRRGLPEP